MSSSDAQADTRTTKKAIQSPDQVSESVALTAPAPDRFSEPVVEGKWSPRATTLFIVVTCGLAWLAIIAAVIAIL